MAVPPFLRMQVVAQSPPDGLTVVARSGQLPGLPIKVLYPYADPIRVKQFSLPSRGTWGLVAFPEGDIRNGLWLGAYYSNLENALNGPASGAQSDPFTDYEAHFSGFWRTMNATGEVAMQWPDGSYALGNVSGTLPTTYRTIVGSGQIPQQQAFPWAQRVPNPPKPFYYGFHHQAGTTFTVDPTGNVTVSGASGAIQNFIWGGSTFSLDVSGNTTVSGANGASFKAIFNSSSVQIDSSGNVTVSGATGTTMMFVMGSVSLTFSGNTATLNVGSTFNIELGGAGASDALALVSKLVSAFNGHTHSGVQSGGSDTGTTVSTWSASTIQSAVAKVSS